MPFDVQERYLPTRVAAGSYPRTAAEPGLDLSETDSNPMAQTEARQSRGGLAAVDAGPASPARYRLSEIPDTRPGK
jgi:hypothetical protein